MPRRTRIALIIAFGLLPTLAAYAWNGTGHMTVSIVAYRELNDTQRGRIVAILKNHPHYDSYLAADRPSGVEEREWVFLRASTWSDYVRPGRDKPESVTKYHRGPWHYINEPLVRPGDESSFTPAEIAPKSPNVLELLEECTLKLKSPDTEPVDRAVTLCWLFHLVGDVHQPLHTVALFSKAQFPTGDQGGNLFLVRSHGQTVRLHALWDDILGTSATYEAVEQLGDELMDDPRFARAKLKELDKNMSFQSWVDESARLAKSVAYHKGYLEGASAEGHRDVSGVAAPPLPTSYEAVARSVSQRRVVLAGYRLADLLKSIATSDPVCSAVP